MSTPPVRRDYTLRLHSAHGEGNALESLELALRRDGEDWVEHNHAIDGSPFLDFLFDILRCQLAYLRMNATERALDLTRVHGLARVRSEDFVLTRFDVGFAIETASRATAEDLAYLAERCLACPISRNLGHVRIKRTRVVVGHAAELPAEDTRD
ncbi:MAG: hypothetical protein EP330_11345 [Deltaproteobacteria bacterium]|nr:MAG: hypothetical protein EP330_11345 [Deltaproteobacteria bacterium]